MLPPSPSPLLRVWQDKRTNTGEKQLDDAVQKKSTARASTLPDISATTPKVSLFKFQGMGQELIDACANQTKEFSDIAATKLGFMLGNAPSGSCGCVIQNATGVRLSLVNGGQAVDYPAPSIIEPGECASFVVLSPDPSTGMYIYYKVQVFEGPVATPVGGGWKAPTQEGLEIPQFQLGTAVNSPIIGVTPSTATARVQVKAGGELVPSTLTWKVDRLPGGAFPVDIFQYTLTQSLD